MAVYNAWVVEYKNGSTWTAIGDVLNLNINVGRRAMPDQWPASSAIITVRYPNGWATPLANFTSGTKIRVFAPGRSSTKPTWTGVVADLQFALDIPWNSSTQVGPGDELTITAEGYLAIAGRAIKLVEYPIPAIRNTEVDADGLVKNGLNRRALLVCGLGSSDVFTYDIRWYPFDGSRRYNFIPADVIQQVSAFGLFRVIDGVRKNWTFTYAAGDTDDPAMFVGDPAQFSTVATVGFSDTANNSTNRIFDNIQFEALSDSYYDAATANASGNGMTPTTYSRTYNATLGIQPERTFITQFPTTDAANSSPNPTYETMVDYYSRIWSDAEFGVSSISATASAQNTQNLDTLGITDIELGYLPLYVVPITLRGQTIYAQIEGVSVTADTEDSRFTYYLTPTGLTGWFTLDSNAFGVLDSNRLALYSV